MGDIFEGHKVLSEEILPLNGVVICDVCSEDWTNRPESGGFNFGSYGYCPDCAKAKLSVIKGYGEEHYIKEFCPPDMSHADWIRSIRARSPQGDNIVFRTYE